MYCVWGVSDRCVVRVVCVVWVCRVCFGSRCLVYVIFWCRVRRCVCVARTLWELGVYCVGCVCCVYVFCVVCVFWVLCVGYVRRVCVFDMLLRLIFVRCVFVCCVCV